jgi:hypothetical protein
MPTSTYNLIYNAIRNKQQVIATYKGHIREMCPHAIGTKNGREQALFYQFGGTSSSGKIVPGSTNNWRCLTISELTNISVRHGDWHTANNHSQSQTCIDIVDLYVEI